MKAVLKLLTLQTRKGASTPIAITATSGGGQSANCGAAYANPLVATITPALSGVSVTFTAPASGASGTFASTGTNTETTVTVAGVATSSVFTANTTGGAAYNVTAAAGALSCNFSLTNITYQALMLSTFGAAVVTYWPLTETTGSVATDVKNGYNGVPNGITWAQLAGPGASMGSMPLLDGLNDDINIYTAGFAAAFPSSKGAISFWTQVATGVWTDGAYRDVVRLGAASADELMIGRTNNNNQLVSWHTGTGGQKTLLATLGTPPAGLFHVLVTWDTADKLYMYVNNVSVGTPPTGLTAWGNPPAATKTRLGSNAGGAEFYKGYFGHVIVLNDVPTPAQRNILATPF